MGNANLLWAGGPENSKHIVCAQVRYYLTAGHGGFGWLPDECEAVGFSDSLIARTSRVFRSGGQ